MMRVLSLGAGVQSSTLALLCAKGEYPVPDFAVFADTQAEPRSVYEWLDWLERQLPFEVVRVTQGDLWTDSLRKRTSKLSGRQYVQNGIPFWIKDSTGKRGATIRKCTRDYKIFPIQREVKRRIGLSRRMPKEPVVTMMIGISTDEASRMKPSREPWMKNTWPLIEMGMSRHACLEWMKRNGYPAPPRSACVFCPYHSTYEWRRMKTEEPYEFARAVEFERQLKGAISDHDEVIRGEPFLWDGLADLSDADFSTAEDRGQYRLFGNECEGMCGV